MFKVKDKINSYKMSNAVQFLTHLIAVTVFAGGWKFLFPIYRQDRRL